MLYIISVVVVIRPIAPRNICVRVTSVVVSASVVSHVVFATDSCSARMMGVVVAVFVSCIAIVETPVVAFPALVVVLM